MDFIKNKHTNEEAFNCLFKMHFFDKKLLLITEKSENYMKIRLF